MRILTDRGWLQLLMLGTTFLGCTDLNSTPLDMGMAVLDSGGPAAGDRGGDGGSDGGSDGGPTGRTIRGTRMIDYVTEAGVTTKPVDLSSVSVAAYFQTTSGYVAKSGIGQSDGTFAISGALPGSYWLRLEPLTSATSRRLVQWFFSDTDSIDLGYTLAGRSTLSRAKVSPTNLVINLNNLKPWQAGDDIQVFVSNFGENFTLNYGNIVVLQGSPMPSDTALQNLTFDFAKPATPVQLPPPLLNASFGDTPYITRLQQQPAPLGLSTIAESFQPTPFSIVDGQTSYISGSFVDTPQTRQVHVSWQRSSFLAQGAKVSSKPLQNESSSYNLLLMPWGTQNGLIGGTPELLSYSPSGGSDIDTDLSYGNPFPAAWPTVFLASYSAAVPYMAPRAAGPGLLYASVSSIYATLPSPATVLVSPVLQPKVNGRDAFMDQTGVGLNPTLTWLPPSIGTAAGYRILVYRVYADNAGASRTQAIAQIHTAQPILTVPPTLLETGGTYIFRIIALTRPAVDFSKAPLRDKFPSGYAEILTGTLQVE